MNNEKALITYKPVFRSKGKETLSEQRSSHKSSKTTFAPFWVSALTLNKLRECSGTYKQLLKLQTCETTCLSSKEILATPWPLTGDKLLLTLTQTYHSSTKKSVTKHMRGTTGVQNQFTSLWLSGATNERELTTLRKVSLILRLGLLKTLWRNMTKLLTNRTLFDFARFLHVPNLLTTKTFPENFFELSLDTNNVVSDVEFPALPSFNFWS